jgi:hypothetical protein
MLNEVDNNLFEHECWKEYCRILEKEIDDMKEAQYQYD